MVKKAISKAIKSQNWLAIEYQNKEESTTKYWIAIKDIDIDKKMFSVDAFNFTKMSETSNGSIEANIYFDNIKAATFIPNTKYDQPLDLMEKIENNIDELSWLRFDAYRENVLDYIQDCMVAEETPYQRETALVRGIDEDELNKLGEKGLYKLTLQQIADLVPKLERLSKQREKNRYESVTLIFNLLSINTPRGLFVVAYKELAFNPVKSTLEVLPEIMFNYTFTSNERDVYKHHLKNYLDVDTDAFLDLFMESPAKAKDMLQEALKHKETLDDRPYIMDMVRLYHTHIEKEIDRIKIRKKEKELSTPLKAFFGNMTSSYQSGRVRNVDIALIDDRVNIDQLRVVYNSLTKPITYVQGPPGTGKTQTIINVLISAFFNNDKVLVSSNNNKPINDIYNKLLNLKSNKGKVQLPLIRLGNKEETLNSLKNFKEKVDYINRLKVDEEKLEKYAEISATDVKEINNILIDFEKKIELEEEVDALKAMRNNLKLDLRGVILDSLTDKKEQEISAFKTIDEDNVKKYLNKIDDRFWSWLFFTGVKNFKRIFEPKNAELLSIINMEKDEDKIKEFNKYIKKDENLSNFQKIFPVILTTNQSSHRLGSQESAFDLVIIDEAGQSSIGYSLFTIARAKRLLLVGDQNQLKPVIDIAVENNKALMKKYRIGNSYDYLENSILLTMQKVDTISKFVLLRYHYRSRKEIINFSNQRYYSNQLKLSYVDTFFDNALEFINVESNKDSFSNNRNIAISEIDAIIQDIKDKKYKNVGIITPFRNQAELLKDTIRTEGLDYVNAGTIHTFQGDEKDVIYFSSTITSKTYDKTFDWVKDNKELINVATTRARNKFILVGDEKQILEKSGKENDLSCLLKYVKKNGIEIEVKESDKPYFINGANFKNYDTIKEKEFFDTINQLLTMGDKYIMREKVSIKSIISKFKDARESKYGFTGEFDLVISKKYNNVEIPVVVVELDGDEHREDQKVMKRDKIKKEICDSNNLKLIRIDNKYSRRYMFIKRLLSNVLK